MTKKHTCAYCGLKVKDKDSKATAFTEHWHLTCLYTAYPPMAPEKDRALYTAAHKLDALVGNRKVRRVVLK